MSIATRARKLTSAALLGGFVLGHVLALPVLAQATRENSAYAVEVPASNTLLLSVTGIIGVAATDLLGGVGALELVADIGTFRIAEDAKAGELRSHVGRRVTLRGERATDERGNLVLAVRDYAPGKS
jgi:hypothetical protein